MCNFSPSSDPAARNTLTAAALHAALLDADSATLVMERLCAAPVSISRLPQSAALPRSLPGAGAVHRTVQLVCGERLLSHADLWFSPDHLPPGLVRQLEETTIPFGRVVRSLELRRRLLGFRLGRPGDAAALEHRALLLTPAGAPVAEVWERYDWGLVSGG